jgi:hypothetical protein
MQRVNGVPDCASPEKSADSAPENALHLIDEAKAAGYNTKVLLFPPKMQI